MKEVKTVSINLKELQVKVKGSSDMSKEEYLNLALKELGNDLLKGKHPNLSYNVSDKNVMTLEECKLGQIVSVENEGLGVITEVKNRKLPLTISTKKGNLQAAPVACKKETDVDPQEVMKILARKDWEKDMGWHQGKCGYYVNGNEVIPIIVGKEKKKYTEIIPLQKGEGKDRFYNLEPSKFKFVYDTKAEAEKVSA